MPSPTQNTFIDRIRQIMFQPIRNQAPEPVRPDYNESPSADEAIQIRVDADYSEHLRSIASMAASPAVIDWAAIGQRSREIHDRIARDQADLMRYQAQESVARRERYLSRTTLEQVRDRLMAGNIWHHPHTHRGAPETIWFDEEYKKDGFYLQGPMEPGGAIEAQVKKAGITCIVLPSISLESGQVEYRKHSVEPTNGAQRTEFEEFAMAEIRNWARKGFPGDIRK